MASVPITQKTTATSTNSDLMLLVTQKENVGGTEKDALRRMSQSVYEWSELPADIRLAVQTALLAIRQTQWAGEDNAADIASVAAKLSAHTSVEVGTKTLTNTQAFPFNNSVQSVALSKTQANGDYIVMTSVTSASGNVGEVEITDKLTNGFKLAYTGSASSVTIRYVVIGGFTE